MTNSMPRLRYRITTLGCRVNHAEAREIESVLAGRGLHRAAPGQDADLEVVHTCTVTGSAAAKSRQAIRRACRRARSRRRNHHGRELSGKDLGHTHDLVGGECEPEIIVTGCFGTSDPDQAARLAGSPGRVIQHTSDDGSPLTDRLARRVDRWLAGRRSRDPVRKVTQPSCPQKEVLPLPVVRPAPGTTGPASRHIRAELKIQDGCDAWCTFCVIPRIRRPLRSKRIGDVVAEARRLVELGHREIVLTGIFIGAYGHETALRRRQARPDREPLAELLDAVAGVSGLQRLRVSSMEPGDVTPALLDAMVANAPVVVPHLHLPLQSGSDGVLARMNRQYRVGDYLEMIEQVNEALTTPEGLPPALSTDIICGFPGETEGDFERTVEVARRVGYLHMHVFPFSPRPQTAAARWRSAFVDPRTVRHRVRRLLDLEADPRDGLSIRFRRRLAGREVRVIVEQPEAGDPPGVSGRCDHYVRIRLPEARPRGVLVRARVTEVTPQRTMAEVLPAEIPLPVVPADHP